MLERQFPYEFAPYDRRPIPVEPEPPERRRISVAFVLPDLKGKTLAEVAAFPVITEQAEPPEPSASKWKAMEPEPEPERTWNGDVGGLGKFAGGDLPIDGNGG